MSKHTRMKALCESEPKLWTWLTRYEEAFNVALNQNDVALVAWICSQVSPHTALGTSPPPAEPAYPPQPPAPPGP